MGWMESTMIKNLTKHSIACTWNLFTESEFHINKDLFLASCSNLRCFFRFLRPVNLFSHVSQWSRTWKHCIAGSMWCFRLHSSFFIRTQDQHTAYQFSELLLTTWVKLAKQVQMFLKFHLQHSFPDMQLHDSENILECCQKHCKDHISNPHQLSQELFIKNHTAQASRTYR